MFDWFFNLFQKNKVGDIITMNAACMDMGIEGNIRCEITPGGVNPLSFPPCPPVGYSDWKDVPFEDKKPLFKWQRENT